MYVVLHKVAEPNDVRGGLTVLNEFPPCMISWHPDDFLLCT